MARIKYGKSIDGARLRALLTAHNLSMAEVGRKMGYSSSYISQCIYSGYMRDICITLLEREYAIKYDDYKPVPVAEVVAKDEPKNEVSEANDVAAFDYDKLYRIVYYAVYQATKHALSE